MHHPSLMVQLLVWTLLFAVCCISSPVQAQAVIVTYADSIGDNLIGRTIFRFGRIGNDVVRSDYDGFSMETLAEPTRLVGLAHSPAEVFYADWRDDAGQVYFSRVATDGSPISDSPILSFSTLGDVPFARIYAGLSIIYWSVGGEIKASDLDGANFRNIYQGQFNSAYCAEVVSVPGMGDQLFVFDGSDLDIKIMNLDGTDRAPVGTLRGSFSTSCLTFDFNANNLFWADDFGAELRRASASGGSQSTILTGLDGARDPLFDNTNNKILWSESGRIRRANPDGSQVEDLHTGYSEAPTLSYLDDSELKIYWTVDETTYRSDLDGGNVESLFDLFFVSDYEP